MTSGSKGNRQNGACYEYVLFLSLRRQMASERLVQSVLFGSRASSLCYGERQQLLSNSIYLALNCFVVLLLDGGIGNFRKPGGSLLLYLWLCVEHEEGSMRRGGGGGGGEGALWFCFCYLLGNCRHLTLLLSALVSQLVRWRI